jgi:hypothetical protein
MIRIGAQVVKLGSKGKGNVIRVEGGDVLVLWKNGDRRESLPLSELAWVGLAVHTCDGRAGRVIELGRNTSVRVRLADRRQCWMEPGELAPRERSERFHEPLPAALCRYLECEENSHNG